MKNKLKYKDIVIADAGFVMNLPDRLDRKENAINVLNHLNITGWEFEDGVRFEDEEWRRYGCTQSYINIFKKAIDNDYDSIIVFEDDIKIANMANLEDVDNIFKQIKTKSRKYDFIALGTRPLHGSKIVKNSEYFGSISNCLCTQSFLYKKKFIKHAYNKLKNYQDNSCEYYKVFIDEFINDSCSHEQIYKIPNKLFRAGITIPMIFTQLASYSDNEKNFMNYEGWIEDSFWSALKNGENK
jgi:hypothetical protein